MNNIERYEQIIDEAYENFEKDCIPGTGKKMSKEEFIDFIKTNPEFGREWGLMIEERELSDEERYDLCAAQKSKMSAISKADYIKYNIPTKVINVYHIPKQSVEFIETKIIILPTGKNINND